MRFKIEVVENNALNALLQLEEYLSSTSLTKQEKQLIKIRASQINGCAYCVNMHAKEARGNTETEQRLDLICVWRQAKVIFTIQEQLILEITEQITLLHDGGFDDTLYEKSVQNFGEEKMAQIIMAVIIINGWNRLCVSLQKEVVL